MWPNRHATFPPYAPGSASSCLCSVRRFCQRHRQLTSWHLSHCMYPSHLPVLASTHAKAQHADCNFRGSPDQLCIQPRPHCCSFKWLVHCYGYGGRPLSQRAGMTRLLVFHLRRIFKAFRSGATVKVGRVCGAHSYGVLSWFGKPDGRQQAYFASCCPERRPVPEYLKDEDAKLRF